MHSRGASDYGICSMHIRSAVVYSVMKSWLLNNWNDSDSNGIISLRSHSLTDLIIMAQRLLLLLDLVAISGSVSLSYICCCYVCIFNHSDDLFNERKIGHTYTGTKSFWPCPNRDLPRRH